MRETATGQENNSRLYWQDFCNFPSTRNTFSKSNKSCVYQVFLFTALNNRSHKQIFTSSFVHCERSGPSIYTSLLWPGHVYMHT